jgi:hypothetical protein
MNCNDVIRALMDKSIASLSPSETEAHLRTCGRCRNLAVALSQPVRETWPSPSTLRGIEAGIATDLRPVCPIPPKSAIFAGLVAIFAAIVALATSRLGATAIAAMSPLQTSVILSALAISTGLMAYSLVNQIVPGSRHRISPKLLPLGIAISLVIAMAVPFHFRHEENFLAKGWTCIRAGALLGALAAGPLWLVLRRGVILSPAMTGAAIGLFAGLAGATTLQIHCPNLDAGHILVGHLGVAALGAVIGLLIGAAAETCHRCRVDASRCVCRE